LFNISVYTIRGLRIRTISDDATLTPGFHQINWDGRDDFGDEIARGIYLYKIQVNSPASKQKDTFIGKMVKS
jgi:flagellar hook assembly protein FlgD